MNPAILHTGVQDFIRSKTEADVTRILLSKSPFSEVSARELAEQIEGRSRCEKKLPLWYSKPNIYYPPKISVEQASSQATAHYKARLIQRGSIADLTGGFGVDSFYFAQQATEVVHCEINEQLSKIAEHNAASLGLNNISFVRGNGLEYLERSQQEFGTLYIDPSRRVNTQKVFRLRDCEPDVVSSMDLLTKHASRIIIKTSPLLDIRSGIQDLDKVSEIHVVSVKNDCKELLWIIDRDKAPAEPEIICALLHDDSERIYRFRQSEEKAFILSEYARPDHYVYEPDVALLKAGCFKLITRDFPVGKLHQHSHLYTSKELVPDFPGRIFKLEQQWTYRSFINEKSKLKHANIISRNFPITPAEIKKKFGIKDGGEEYLLFTTAPGDSLSVLHCRRLDQSGTK